MVDALDAAERHGGRMLALIGPEQAEGRRAAVPKGPAGHIVETVEVVRAPAA